MKRREEVQRGKEKSKRTLLRLDFIHTCKQKHDASLDPMSSRVVTLVLMSPSPDGLSVAEMWSRLHKRLMDEAPSRLCGSYQIVFLCLSSVEPLVRHIRLLWNHQVSIQSISTKGTGSLLRRAYPRRRGL